MKGGRERRVHPRYDVEDVQGVLSFSVQARVLNLSLTGVAIETTSPLRIHRPYTFRFGRGSRAVTVTGTVQWSFLRRTERTPEGEVRPVYETGIAFAGVLSELGSEIRSFLAETVVLETENRLCGRFRPAGDEETAEISATLTFQVAQISISGMLVAADFSLPPEKVFAVEIQLDGETVEIEARIVHVREVGSGEAASFLMGVEFRDTAPEQRRALQEFIHREIERREGGEA